MYKVLVTDREGGLTEVSADGDMPLMFSLREAGLPVEGTCGGTAACGTCHVFISSSWLSKLPERSSIELEMLQALENFDSSRSRLSCQISLDANLNGLEVTLAPVEVF